jgi:copper(I)-binding protein
VPKLHRIALPLFAGLAALSLVGCQSEAPKDEAVASAGPEAKPGVMVKDARVVLPGVGGNPGAAYFSLDNQSKAAVSIAAVAVEGVGRAELHASDMKVLDGGKAEAMTHLDFTPGGPHVMLFDVSDRLKAGDQTELTVIYSDGDKMSVPAKVEAMGSAAMGGMEHKN